MFTTLLALTLSAAPPKFEAQEIAKDLSIGYAVMLCDINGDQKPDIVVVDQLRVVWYENPTWKVRTILKGRTKPDNVCITAVDIDGDGQLDLVLGAGWKPFDTAAPGTLHWLSRGQSLDDEWTLHTIPCDEPTVHRVQVLPINGQPRIVLAPLMGRGATVKGNWTDGRPARIMTYAIPKQPTKPESWKPEVLVDSLNVVHNFCATKKGLLFANYDGVHEWTGKLTRLNAANQDNPKSNRGASEIAWDAASDRIGTIEPWHGNQVVVYTNHGAGRHVIDERLKWGHAVKFADLDGDGVSELIVGVRDNGDDKRGVRIYKATDASGAKWERTLIDPDGVAVEDLAVGDLDGDGRPDIVAVGRATKNVKIYWNRK